MIAQQIATTFALSLLLASCGVNGPRVDPCELSAEQQPSKLFDGEQSYSGYETYAHLASDSTFRRIEGNGFSRDSSGLVADRFEVKRVFWGHSGRLEYVFYFGKLAEMRFHPDNPRAFSLAARSRGLPVSSGSELKVGDVTYWATERHEVLEIFGVSDTRITSSYLACVAAND